MIVIFTLLLILQALSLMLMIIITRVYHNRIGKFSALLRVLGDATAIKTTGRLLIPLYILMTLCISMITIGLFVWQPHLL